jgi:DNA-binding NarL/FixJ family response regulator
LPRSVTNEPATKTTGTKAALRDRREAALPPPARDAPIGVVVVDDSTVFLEAICLALSRRPEIDLLGAASEVETGEYMVRRWRPGVAVVDVRMPGIGGVGLARRITEEHPETRVVALTVSHDESDLTGMLRAGAWGYVLKPVARDELPRAIRAAASGDAWLTPRMTSKLIDSFLNSPSAAVHGGLEAHLELTPRERAVLSYVAHGRTNREIAEAMFIAETTVKTHLKSIFSKLEVRNRSEAGAVAWREGLAGVSSDSAS